MLITCWQCLWCCGLHSYESVVLSASNWVYVLRPDTHRYLSWLFCVVFLVLFTVSSHTAVLCSLLYTLQLVFPVCDCFQLLRALWIAELVLTKSNYNYWYLFLIADYVTVGFCQCLQLTECLSVRETVAESWSAEVDDQPTCTACNAAGPARNAGALCWGAVSSRHQVVSLLLSCYLAV